ncbi:MAG: thioredoxin family protein [Candidatus Zixiibacteriota bacterium]
MSFFKDLFNRKPQPGKPTSVTDENFEVEVLSSPLPVVVDFWSPRCPPCQVMAGLLNEIGPDFVGRVKLVKLNVEQNPETAVQYQIHSVPTLIIFKRGKAVERLTGLIPLNPLKALMDRLSR